MCKAEQLCRPERMLYLLSLAHASRNDELGHFVLSSLKAQHAQRWAWATSLGLKLPLIGSREEDEKWVETLGLAEPVVGDYVVASDKAWSLPSPNAPGQWTRWPFQWLTLESYLTPWQGHFKRLRSLLDDENLSPEDWEALQEERQYLQILLAESRTYSSARLVVDLLNSSETAVNEKSLSGVSNTLEALKWIQSNREALEAILRMEGEAYTGIQSVRKMSWAEFLTLSDGLFSPSAGNARLRIEVLGEPFEFRPQEVSRKLLSNVIRLNERTAGAFFESARADASGSIVPLPAQGQFISEIKPMVEEFVARLEGSRMSPEEASGRKQYVLAKLNQFSFRYRQGLFGAITSTPSRPPAGLSCMRSSRSSPSLPRSWWMCFATCRAAPTWGICRGSTTTPCATRWRPSSR